MSTPAEEMRAAVTVLRCVHKFPMNRPPGSTDKPGVCIHCGVSWRFDKPAADWLVEPLAEWLEETADCDCGVGDDHWPQKTAALTTARAITGGTP